MDEWRAHGAIYVGAACIVFHAFDQTDVGIWVRNDFVAKLGRQASAAELVVATTNCLAASRPGIPYDAIGKKDLDARRRARLESMGVKNDAQMLEKYSCLSIYGSGGRIDIIPTRKTDWSYHDLDELAVSVDLGVANLSEELERQLRRCK